MKDDRDILNEVFTAFRRPLEFAASNNFLKLHALKDMNRLSAGVIGRFLPAVGDNTVRGKIEMLGDLLHDFDDQPLPEKRRRVQEALDILNEEEGSRPEEEDDPYNERISEGVHHDFSMAAGVVERAPAYGYNSKRFNHAHGRGFPGPSRRQFPGRREERGYSGGYRDREVTLDSPVDVIWGVGRKIRYIFQNRGINSVFDLLFYIPRDYQDRTNFRRIGELAPGENILIFGRIENVEVRPTRRGKVLIAYISDDTGSVKCLWFGSRKKAFLDKIFLMGREFVLWGKVEEDQNREKVLYHPEWEEADDRRFDRSINFSRITPVYPLYEGLRQKTVRKILYNVVRSSEGKVHELIPHERCEALGILPFAEGIKYTHFPEDGTSMEELKEGRSPAQKAMAFYEFLLFSTALSYLKKENSKRSGPPVKILHSRAQMILNNLPFQLTEYQEKVYSEIKEDLLKPWPMNRLLQGEVGSGKTILALLTAAIMIDNGYQVALLAPTGSLAWQHYRKFTEILDGAGTKVGLLAGYGSKPSKDEVLSGIEDGSIHLLVGTHAIFNEKVTFSNLGMVIIDEGHRFGVHHRLSMLSKGENPHVLVMSATPIPRSLSMTFYGNMDISILEGMPEGRALPETEVVHRDDMDRVYSKIKEEVERGNMVYYLCPVIDERNINSLKDVVSTEEILRETIFPGYRIRLLHGRLRPEEKVETIDAVLKGEVDILVCTTLVEVGMDVPNAMVMVVENPERFGISQIHQMRGRVGRRGERGVCFLIISGETPHQSLPRIDKLAEVYNGMEIALEDLKIRGCGEFFGFRQSGIPELRGANPVQHSDMMELAREEAERILEENPYLDEEKYQNLKKYILRRFGNNILLGRVI